MTYRYYVPYDSAAGPGYYFAMRDEPIESEDAIRELHEEIERVLGYPVVVQDWKRIY